MTPALGGILAFHLHYHCAARVRAPVHRLTADHPTPLCASLARSSESPSGFMGRQQSKRWHVWHSHSGGATRARHRHRQRQKQRRRRGMRHNSDCDRDHVTSILASTRRPPRVHSPRLVFVSCALFSLLLLLLCMCESLELHARLEPIIAVRFGDSRLRLESRSPRDGRKQTLAFQTCGEESSFCEHSSIDHLLHTVYRRAPLCRTHSKVYCTHVSLHCTGQCTEH